MASRVVRMKARRATLQAPPAGTDEAEQTEETQAHPTHQASLRETPSNDEETKESEPPRGDLFRGHKFYLARTLRPERRAEMRMLITQNGGDVVAEMTDGAVEIVERGYLKPNENWVATDFIEDSIADGELKNVLQYLAPRVDKTRRTPSGRPLKRFFTVNEQGKMLQFLKDQFPQYYDKHTVPERIWKIAVEQKIIDRTSSSMHEHYRKQLARLTNKEREVILEKTGGVTTNVPDSLEAETEGETETESEINRAALIAEKQEQRDERPSVEKRRSDDMETKSEEDDEIQGRAKKRMKKTRTSEDNANNDETPEEQTPEEQEVVREEPVQRPETPPRAEEASQREEPAPENIAPTEQQEEPERGTGETFHSYWSEVASSTSTRHQLDRFFIPPSPPPSVDTSQTALLSSAHRTPRRGRRLSHSNESPAVKSTPTPQKRRRDRRTSTDSMASTPGPRPPARAAQQELLTQLEEMVGQRMTPPSRRKSLDRLIPVSQASPTDADDLLTRLQFETAHDLNTICSALYWASGDSNVARAFLLGHMPAEIWCPADDHLLLDYMRDDVTEVELANARHRGVFQSMSHQRPARDILRRIQYLL